VGVRRGLLGLMLVTMPLSVDVPGTRDSTGARGAQTRLEVAGDLGQLSVVSRGCEGQVIRETKGRLRTGAFVVEQQFPNDVVIGVRAGVLRERVPTDTYPGGVLVVRDVTIENDYTNPFVAFESPFAGAGIGWMKSRTSFLLPDRGDITPNVTGHLRIGDRGANFTMRYMEDVPLEALGHFGMEFGFPVRSNVDMAIGLGALGPYDGAMVGVRGRVWLTPEAALQLRAAAGNFGQYDVSAGVAARFPVRAP